MIRFTARVVGSGDVVEAIRTGIVRVRREVATELGLLGLALLRKVKQEKLLGQVLKRRTGNLGNSVNVQPQGGVETKGNVLSISVGSAVWYGRMWELTGHKKIVPVKAKFLAWKDGGVWHRAKSVSAQAPRPWLAPALAEMRPIVVQRLQAAVARGIAGKGP